MMEANSNTDEVQTPLTKSGNPMDPESLLEYEKLGFTIVQGMKAVRYSNAIKDKRRSREVCICGHSEGAHKVMGSGTKLCQPNARQCHCQEFNAVLVTTNLKAFNRFSTGNWEDHALSKGISSLMDIGGSFTWVPGALHCLKCGSSDDKIIPATIDTNGNSAKAGREKFSGLKDIFMCVTCESRMQSEGNLRWK